ncbi:hypothetical protein MUP35_00575 [Patescibacteria group bacterium]|nr:hypothetical protein [Patescibacteria group bacterium]
MKPLFDKAQNKSDFQFIFTLLRFMGIQGPGEDPYENSLETIDALMEIEKKIEGRAKLNVFLWVYGHIIESSEPYEIIANLLHVCAGETYRTFNYPYKKTNYGYRPQSPTAKINHLEKLAEVVKMPFVLEPIKEIFDKNLRNAVFHSDYSVYKGEVFINEPRRIYSKGEVLILINKALAYHEAMKNLIKSYTKSYNKPKIIKTSPGFSPDPNERAQVIVRKNHGVVALKAALTKKQIKAGKISWLAGYCTSYEYKLIDHGQFLLPKNRVEFWNSILRKMPDFLYKRLIGPIEKYIVNR